MKLSLLLTFTVLVVQAKALESIRGYGFNDKVKDLLVLSDDSSSSDPQKVLEGEECAPLRQQMNSYITGVLKFSDAEIVEWSCNDIQRTKSMDRVHAKEVDLATQHNPCVKALEELIASDDAEGTVDTILGDSDHCHNELAKDLPILRETLGAGDAFIASDSTEGWFIPVIVVFWIVPGVPPFPP